jgi:pyruvate,water dikinase
MTDSTRTDLRWDPPGPGSWSLDRVYKRTTITRPFQDLFAPAMADGFHQFTSRYGLPLDHIDIRYVNGYGYGQPRLAGVPAKAQEKAGPPPPRFVLRVMSRLIPELRRRTRAAKRTLAEKRWRTDRAEWEARRRPARIAANLALQDEATETLDDGALAAHLERAVANVASGCTEHFWLLGCYLPVGDLVAHAERWGLPVDEVLDALAGSSPATADAAALASKVRAAVGGPLPVSLDAIRRHSPQAAGALDELLRLYGWRLVTLSDLDGQALIELPDLVLDMIAKGTGPASAERGASSVDDLRERVPASERAVFDELLAEARAAYGTREDNVGLTLSWTVGLLRRALLEAGRRLHAAGGLDEPTQVFELGIDETQALLRGADAGAPGIEEVRARVALREAADAADPPATLGPAPSPPPSFDAFPAAMARVAKASMAISMRLGAARGAPPMTGVGIGSAVYRGTARVACDPGEALARLEPGDVLVTSITTPAFNGLLPLVGAIVTAEGGALSHPAIVARELGVPAVVGAAGALDIPDGSLVELDPAAGTVKVVQP